MIPSTSTLAGRPERFLAFLLDNIFLLLPAAAINRVLGEGQAAIVANFICGLAYYSFFTGSAWQASPAQRLLSIYVAHTDGRPLRLRDAVMRYLAYVMPVLPLYTSIMDDRTAMSFSLWLCLIWFVPILVRQDRSGIHDQVCGMRVVTGRVLV